MSASLACLAKMLCECQQVWRVLPKCFPNVGESGKYLPNCLPRVASLAGQQKYLEKVILQMRVLTKNWAFSASTHIWKIQV